MPKVLFVDDNAEIRDLYCHLFEAAGIKAKCLESGTETLDWLSKPDNRVSVIVLDLSMSPLDGLTVAEEIRRNEEVSQTKKVDIAFLTGKDIDDAITRIGNRCGVKRIFSKSEEAQDIVIEIAEWIK